MLLDGVSLQGSYHDANQDSFLCKMLEHGFVVALSDGLGSKRDSKSGSAMLCRSVIELAEEKAQELSEIDPKEFVRLLHERWLRNLAGHNIKECYATMLFFVLYEGRVFAARLGDGFIGFWLDDSVEVLFDTKEEYYANETDCLTEDLAIERVAVYESDVTEFHGGVMCSDGIGFAEMTHEELSRFTRAFVEGYCQMDQEETVAHIKDWLKDWPGADDKTLAFFISGREHTDETSV